MTVNSKIGICLVSFPTGFSEVHNIFLNDLVKILQPSCKSLYLLTSKFSPDTQLPEGVVYVDLGIALHKKGAIHPVLVSHILQLFKILLIQGRMCWHICLVSSRTDIIFFYLGGADIILPLLVSKLLGKKVITSGIGQFSKTVESSSNKHQNPLKIVFIKIYSSLERTVYLLADGILVESPSIISFIGIEEFKDKIFASGIRYINTDVFKIIKKYDERKRIIGFIGRFSEEKGILNFIFAIPLLLERNPDLIFHIAGDGHLLPQMSEIIERENWKDRVILLGWINNRQQVADFLNELKVLVIPSTSEGVPTILLESMACGTPVLASRVGGIPDIIDDGKTGFLLQNNSPEQIADNILKILTYPEIRSVIKVAGVTIESNYQFNNAVERYAKIFQNCKSIPFFPRWLWLTFRR